MSSFANDLRPGANQSPILTIRQGQKQDAAWVIRLLKEGAMLGHFNPPLQKDAEFLLTTLFDGRPIPMRKLRNNTITDRLVQASMTVADVAGSPAGFLICLDDDQGTELHLAGTLKTQRRKGAFRALIRQALYGRPENACHFFARCYKRSSWAVSALCAEGFSVSSEGDPVELALTVHQA